MCRWLCNGNSAAGGWTTTAVTGLSHTPPPSTSTMISRQGAAALCWVLLSWLSFTNVFVAAQSTPESVITPFSNLPSRLFFFDDSEVSLLYFGVEMRSQCSTLFSFKVAIYHDSVHGNLYVSTDEGRSWKQADGIPNGAASMIIAHPFDNRYVNYFLLLIIGVFFIY